MKGLIRSGSELGQMLHVVHTQFAKYRWMSGQIMLRTAEYIWYKHYEVACDFYRTNFTANIDFMESVKLWRHYLHAIGYTAAIIIGAASNALLAVGAYKVR